MTVTLYNAIARLVEAPTFRRGVSDKDKLLAEAWKASEEATAKHLEVEENRYIGIWSLSVEADERVRYESLSAEEQEKYLEHAIAELRSEEETDPDAFAERYGIKPPFWEREEWQEFVRQRRTMHSSQQVTSERSDHAA